MLGLLNALGSLLAFFSLLYVLPMATALLYDDGTFTNFLAAGLCTLGLGLAFHLGTCRRRRPLRHRDGYLVVVRAWTGMAGLACIPLLLNDTSRSFTDAYFESMSALTTTGATVYVGLDTLAPALNLWRHVLQWVGGMGIVVLAVAILPMLGVGGMQLYCAETPGPMKDTKLTPRISQTAKALWLVYACITALCILALVLAGMPVFDAICHAFAAMSLGGFSTHDANVGYYDSPAIEAVLIVFMVIAALNFATHFRAIRHRSIRPYFDDPEARWVVTLLLGSCLLIALFVWAHGVYPSFLTSLRHVAFNLVSLATDCGFASVDYAQWPVFAPFWMLILSCVTVSSGSTGGGLKMFRNLILLRQVKREVQQLVHPTAVIPLRIGGRVISTSVGHAVFGYVFIYCCTLTVLCLALLQSGLDFESALSAIIACINNAGPGLNEVGPASNYAGLTDFQKWVCTIAMLAGRIEILTLLVVLTPTYWRK